ncbi:Nar1p [Sugiyamaella lignohabitans]|uniref:Cytosolic Fe-S cluster assembly factor NAR1 n=1 Tax=Sugiyamaella lignohabitans TaxID=796027 RepID=A0A167E3I2_9ASCO|nr:Nar1p [Sugiyamaella lignohabitans]ANB13593.1 Nar1p [Sugiyamaella lignohabitans]
MSTILSADDLNDFISPGVACIKPVEVEKSNETGRAEIEIGIDGIPMEVSQDSGEKKSLKSAQISLSDCLACSGCITSAETVLVSMQSHSEVLSALEKNSQLPVTSPDRKIFVASISHQVRVSLAAAFDLSVSEVDNKLRDLLVTRLGFRYVIGTEIGRAIALEHAAIEVSEKSSGTGPVLCSSCPGWTCYVEKTHAHMIPYLSKVKSAQQITGTLIKEIISRQTGIKKNNIYHVSIMPCFDKKLEAARAEFGEGNADSEDEVRDVDCVITSKEIVQLLIEKDIPFESLSSQTLPQLSEKALSPDGWPYQHQWLSHQGTSSGGYLEHVIARLIHTRSKNPSNTSIQVIPGKNADIVEYHVQEDGQTIARVAQIYGFRNIQNLVRKLKPASSSASGAVRKSRVVVSRRAASSANGTHNSIVATQDPSKLDYVEVMACPGGCINGGGQIGKPDTVTAKEWKDKLEHLYSAIAQTEITRAQTNQWIEQLWLASHPTDMSRLLTANYQAIAPPEPTESTAAITLGTKW